jgi:hypothetical protein
MLVKSTPRNYECHMIRVCFLASLFLVSLTATWAQPADLAGKIRVSYRDGDPAPNYGVEYHYYKTSSQLVFLDSTERSLNNYTWNSGTGRLTDSTFGEHFDYTYTGTDTGTFVFSEGGTGEFVTYDASWDLDYDGTPDGEQIDAGNLPTYSHKLDLDSDVDGDGLTLAEEGAAGTDPNNQETDVVADGLVSYYRLAGNFDDFSGNGIQVTEQGSVDFIQGRSGNLAAVFDADADGLQSEAQSQPVSTGPVSIALWYYQTSNLDSQLLAGLESSGNVRCQLGLIDGIITVFHGMTTYNIVPFNAIVPQLNQWNHLALTVAGNGQVMKVYLNGSLIGEGLAGVNRDSTVSHQIGAHTNLSAGDKYRQAFKGYLQDVRIYDRCLSASEVDQIYGFIRTPAPPELDLQSLYETTPGIPITINATPTGGEPTTFTYQWYSKGFIIPSQYGGTAASFTIDGLPQNEGTWKVVVTNDTGVTEASFEARGFTDTDSDGLSDYRESNITNTDPALADTDSDGLNDYVEVNVFGSDPNDTDSDDDSLLDAAEVNTHNTSPIDADSDDDMLTDYQEIITYFTNPNLADTDSDGLNDGNEVNIHLTNPNLADTDSDGLNDGDEVNIHLTLPKTGDTDGDGINDGDEVNTYGSDPLDVDSDDDTILDGIEVRHASFGFDPAVSSTARLLEFQQAAAELPGVLTDAQQQGINLGGVSLTPSAGGGNSLSVDFIIEESVDLSSWTTVDTVSHSLDTSGTKKFIRVRTPE